MINSKFRAGLLATTLVGLCTPVLSQVATNTGAAATKSGPQNVGGGEVAIDEIMVTARKRSERLLDVPVAVNALSTADLQRYGASTLNDIAELAPQIMIAKQASGSGNSFVIRGIGSSTLDTGFDQSVSIDIDGVQTSRGRSLQQSYFDLAQVEVLKGPQALFFGKNSPAGVIALTSANPTSEFSAGGDVGYELNARELTASGYISGPLTPTLGARLAFTAVHSRGWIENMAYQGLPGGEPATGRDLLPSDRWGPKEREIMGRLTLAFHPAENFDATFKLSGGTSKDNGEGTNNEVVFCPTGHVSNGGPADPYADCQANGKNSKSRLPRDMLNGVIGVSSDGSSYSRYAPIIASLSANWALNKVKLTSVTGYYKYDLSYFENSFDRTVYDLDFGSQVETYKSFSQEVRALTEFDSPVNVMLGAYYQSTNLDNDQSFRIAPLPVDPATGYYVSIAKTGFVDSKTYSGFGQLMVKVTQDIEVDAGLRWTHETKNVSQHNTYVTPLLAAAFPMTLYTGDYSDNNVSPEVTISWHPTRQTTYYAAFKTGYKSGGFGLPALLSFATTPSDFTFQSEKAKGGEIGAKGEFLDGKLTINSTAYLYDYSNLQVDIFDGSKITYQILNAASARTEGAEVNLDYKPTHQLALRTGVGYNHSRYRNFDSPCFSGQTISQGCNLRPVGGAYTRQDLSGHPTVRAPDWSANAGFTYETPLNDALSLTFDGDAIGVSKYYFSETEGPGTQQPGYVKLNASIRLHGDNSLWSVALIGRNLTNKYIIAGGSDRPNSGSGTGTAVGTPADVIGYMDRARQLTLQLSFKY